MTGYSRSSSNSRPSHKIAESTKQKPQKTRRKNYYTKNTMKVSCNSTTFFSLFLSSTLHQAAARLGQQGKETVNRNLGDNVCSAYEGSTQVASTAKGKCHVFCVVENCQAQAPENFNTSCQDLFDEFLSMVGHEPPCLPNASSSAPTEMPSSAPSEMPSLSPTKYCPDDLSSLTYGGDCDFEGTCTTYSESTSYVTDEKNPNGCTVTLEGFGECTDGTVTNLTLDISRICECPEDLSIYTEGDACDFTGSTCTSSSSHTGTFADLVCVITDTYVAECSLSSEIESLISEQGYDCE